MLLNSEEEHWYQHLETDEEGVVLCIQEESYILVELCQLDHLWAGYLDASICLAVAFQKKPWVDLMTRGLVVDL
jgi:hypothetical protein